MSNPVMFVACLTSAEGTRDRRCDLRGEPGAHPPAQARADVALVARFDLPTEPGLVPHADQSRVEIEVVRKEKMAQFARTQTGQEQESGRWGTASRRTPRGTLAPARA